jgi:hypothetical protein
MKKDFSRDTTPCYSCRNPRFRGTYRLHLRNELRLLVTVYVFLSSLKFSTLMMEAICYSETSVLTKTT